MDSFYKPNKHQKQWKIKNTGLKCDIFSEWLCERVTSEQHTLLTSLTFRFLLSIKKKEILRECG